MVKLQEARDTPGQETFFIPVENQPGTLDLKLPSDTDQARGQASGDKEETTARSAQLPKRLCCTYV